MIIRVFHPALFDEVLVSSGDSHEHLNVVQVGVRCMLPEDIQWRPFNEHLFTKRHQITQGVLKGLLGKSGHSTGPIEA
jgi:hypothetical protein